jgi:hypothetical protein
LVDLQLPPEGQPVTAGTFQFRLCKDKLRQARRREGCYLLRSNLTEAAPAALWRHYIQLKLTLLQQPPPRIRVNPTPAATASANAV